ncbi:MAG: ribosome maturation factor RimP [Micrococcales bacterium]|nr:ribosome maturation factor RimP [Micrococcales bacterium]
MSTAQQIRAAIEPAVAPLGLIVEDVTAAPAGKRRLVRVLIESDLGSMGLADGTSIITPVSLDTVAAATRAVDQAIEASDVMGTAPYVLEVSSPGTGRPLTTRDQFRRNVGRVVEVHHDDEVTTGRVVEVDRADPARVTLDVPATKQTGAARTVVTLGAAVRGHVQVEFKPVPAPHGPSHSEEDN